GRVAEELIYGTENVTTGASNDIQQATNMARAMVTEWGMSDKLGRLRYVDNQEEIFLGHSVTRSQTISSETAKMIDNEVRRIIEEAEAKAREVLTTHMEDLQKVTKALLEYETLSGSEVKSILNDEPIDRSDPTGTTGESGRRASVPSSGKAAKGPGKDSTGGLEPEPQPGN
ncbi:MAG: cell division protein FtsH, partial [Rhodospirillales bacterium]|nr:cell division protein FtsH [Rhodospirillales bacterium]